jgi:hypothetical protein
MRTVDIGELIFIVAILITIGTALFIKKHRVCTEEVYVAQRVNIVPELVTGIYSTWEKHFGDRVERDNCVSCYAWEIPVEGESRTETRCRTIIDLEKQ